MSAGASRKAKTKTITPPDVMASGLEEWRGTELEDGQCYSDLSASRISLSHQTAKRIKFDRVSFESVDMSGTKLTDGRLRGSRFKSCDMANADWRGANVSCVELIECRMVGFSINEGKIADCSFIHCNGGLIRFRFSSFNAVRFEACNLKESDFQGADLSGVEFCRCDLRNAQMSGAKLKGASLRGSNIEGLAVNAKDVEGAIVDPLQAAYLAPLFGLKVVW